MRKWDKLVDQYHGLDTTIRDLESKLTELRSKRAAAISSAPTMETQELRFKFCAQTQKVFVDPKHSQEAFSRARNRRSRGSRISGSMSFPKFPSVWT